MRELTNNFGKLYFPVKAFVLYRANTIDNSCNSYVESFDMDADGTPINAHPLSQKESIEFAKALTTKSKKEGQFLMPEGLLPSNVVYINNGKNPCAIWHTPVQTVKLLFGESLTIGSGMANIPALLWKADRGNLQVFAVNDKTIVADSALFHAPFFNLDRNGRVCMGNVQVKIPKDCALENFISLWQDYFFNSYFTHLLGGFNPVAGNIIQLWQSLVDKPAKFPVKKLMPLNKTLKNLLP